MSGRGRVSPGFELTAELRNSAPSTCSGFPPKRLEARPAAQGCAPEGYPICPLGSGAGRSLCGRHLAPASQPAATDGSSVGLCPRPGNRGVDLQPQRRVSAGSLSRTRPPGRRHLPAQWPCRADSTAAVRLGWGGRVEGHVRGHSPQLKGETKVIIILPF